MAIQVTCPSCFKRFTVSDQFAGRTGPCPSCQKPIKIPEKAEEVIIHAPEDAGPKDASGKAILNPIRRKEVSLSMPVMLGVGLTSLCVLVLAIGFGATSTTPPAWLVACSALLLAPPLVFIGYWFLRDDELEGYSGQQLLARCGVCALGFVGLWGFYAFVPAYVSGYQSTAEISGMDLAVYLPLMVIIGSIISVAAMELEIVQGVMHYCLYFIVTLILAWISGAPLAAPLNGTPSSPTSVPTAEPDAGPDAAPEDDKPDIPNVLQ